MLENCLNIEKSRQEDIVGVGVLVVTGDYQFLTVRELNTKRTTGKLAGMLSIPMETRQGQESDIQTLCRLFDEEVRLDSVADPTKLRKIHLCNIQLRNEVCLHVWCIPFTDKPSVRQGTDTQDVSDPTFTSLDEVLKSEPKDLTFRPGVRETAISLLNLLNRREGFITENYFDTRDKVPEESFI